jgi:allantoicase
MASVADEIEYKLDNVEVSTLRPEDIDKTFRSKCIGKSFVCPPER